MSIKPVQFWCQKVIPLVYDDSLSYYEQLCKLSDKLNEVISTVNTFNNNYVDEQLSKLKIYVDKQDAQNFENSKVYTDNEISKLELEIFLQIQELSNLVFEKDEALKQWVMLQLEIFKDYIKNIPLPAVLNPLTGVIESVQSTFNSFYDYMRCDAITAECYDNLFLSAEEYDNKQIYAREFDIYSEKILNAFMFVIRSPFDGKFTPVQTVIEQLTALHQVGITTGLFDEKQWSAQVYDDKQINAYNFDWLTVA